MWYLPLKRNLIGPSHKLNKYCHMPIDFRKTHLMQQNSSHFVAAEILEIVTLSLYWMRWKNSYSVAIIPSLHNINHTGGVWYMYSYSSHPFVRATPGARPTKHISIEFEIRWKFKTLWCKIFAADHNHILHMSRQCHCRDVCKISLWSLEYIRN